MRVIEEICHLAWKLSLPEPDTDSKSYRDVTVHIYILMDQ